MCVCVCIYIYIRSKAVKVRHLSEQYSSLSIFHSSHIFLQTCIPVICLHATKSVTRYNFDKAPAMHMSKKVQELTFQFHQRLLHNRTRHCQCFVHAATTKIISLVSSKNIKN